MVLAESCGGGSDLSLKDVSGSNRFCELNHIIIELDKILNLKYNTIEYVKLGSDMCGLIDIQENIMKTYREVLIARRVLVLNKMNEGAINNE